MPRRSRSEPEVFGMSFVDVIIGSSIGMIVVTLIFSSLAGGGGTILTPMRQQSTQDVESPENEPYVLQVGVLAVSAGTFVNLTEGGLHEAYEVSGVEGEVPYGDKEQGGWRHFLINGVRGKGTITASFAVETGQYDKGTPEGDAFVVVANALEAYRDSIGSGRLDSSKRRRLDDIQRFRAVFLATAIDPAVESALPGLKPLLHRIPRVPPGTLAMLGQGQLRLPNPTIAVRYHFITARAKGKGVRWLAPTSPPGGAGYSLVISIDPAAAGSPDLGIDLKLVQAL